MTTIFCIRPKGLNIGNEVIYLGTQHFLRKAFGEEVNLVSLPSTSKYGCDRAGLTAKTIYEINQYGHGVIIGGGNLYENGELEVDLDALEALEVPLMLLSLSRGRVYNRRNELVDRTDAMPARVIMALHRKASLSLARDVATGEYLDSLGCNNQVGGCPSMFLTQVPSQTVYDKSSVLISIRNPSLMSVPMQKQAQVRSDLLEIIALLRTKGFSKIRFLCHDKRDIPFAASFAEVDYVYTEDVYAYLSLLYSCTLNISYRLHATIPCLVFGVPTIKICYDERALSFMRTVGFGEWSINMIHSSNVVAEVANRFERLVVLEDLRTLARSEWYRFHAATTNAFTEFAKEIL